MALLVTALVLYFIPGMIASIRRHRHTGAIIVLNLFLGWTFIGWVMALVWACMNSFDDRQRGEPREWVKALVEPSTPATPHGIPTDSMGFRR